MAPRTAARSSAIWHIGLLLLGVWLLAPVLGAQHVEGYTANLLAMARMAREGRLADTDLLYPLLTDFLYHTRPGMIALLRGVITVSGFDDGAFRAVMIVSLALLLGSAMVTARWARSNGRIAGWAAFLALLLTPGVSEVAFVFNDNLLSAALLCAAVAVVTWRDGMFAYAAAGVLIGAATTIRLDAVLLAPMVVGIAWMRHDAREMLARAAVTVSVTLAFLAAASLALGSTPLDAILVAVHGFQPIFKLRSTLTATAMYFGPLGAGLFLLGWLYTARRWRNDPRGTLLWCLYPVLIVLASLRMANEIRYVLPLLAPFVALHGGRGAMLVAAGLVGRRPAALAAATAGLLLMIVPPLILVRDGPHGTWGRLWMPGFWWRWQADMTDNLATVDRLVRTAGDRGRLLAINGHFNDEFFLKERLIAAGYRPVDARRTFPGCKGFSVYRRNGVVVVQIRTVNEYGQAPTTAARYSALILSNALACPGVTAIRPAFLSVYGSTGRLRLFEGMSPALWRPVLHLLPAETALSTYFTPLSLLPGYYPRPDALPVARTVEGMLRAFPLTGNDLAALRRSADRYVRRPIDRNTPPLAAPDGPISMPAVRRAFAGVCRPAQNGEHTLWPRCIPT